MRTRYFVFFMLLLGSLNCGAARKLEPAPPTPFLNIPGVDRTDKYSNVPFDHTWIAKKFDEKKYTKLIIAPVILEHLSSENQLESTSVFVPTKEAYDKEVNLLAEYTAQSFRKAFAEDPDKRMQVVEQPGPGTLVLEIALTQVIFGHPGVYAGSFASPLPGTGVIASAITQPSVAFEARLKDAQTGEVMATAADRRTPVIRIVDFNQLTAVSPCRDIVNKWADVFVEVFKEGRLKKIRAKWFDWRLW
jgi:hypothetical protein